MKYYGRIGFMTTKESETEPGIWEEVIDEKPYYYDVNRRSFRQSNSESVNDNFTINNDFSIIADGYALTNFSHMRYLEFKGVRWVIATVDVQYPRINLTTGGIYNGE